MRMLARARARERPMAVRTCDGSVAPDWQALPAETERPFRSSAMRRESASSPSK